MFRDAKVGDRVWDTGYGWGDVVEGFTEKSPFEGKTMSVRFVDAVSDTLSRSISLHYNEDGFCDKFNRPTLFWGVAYITPPSRPKRTVKKSKTFYVNIYHDQIGNGYDTREEADKYQSSFKEESRLGEARKVVHEWEDGE